MEKLLRKKAYIALLYALTATLAELISFCVMGLGVFPSFWGIDVAFILALSVLIFIIPWPIASIVINGVLLLFQIVVAIINEALYGMSGMIFSLNMLNLAKEVGGVFSADFVNWWLFVGFVFLYIAEMTAVILIHCRMRTERARLSRSAVILLLVCCIIGENASMILYQATVGSFQSAAVSDELSDYNDDKLLYTTQFIPSKALKKFGFFGFYFMNVSNTLGTLIGGNSASADERQRLSALDAYFSRGEMSESVYGDNIYTGALNGKNIVLIVIESGEWYGINREYTPTLYALATEGIAFTEYYARDKTNVSEALSILGTYPMGISASLEKYELPFALPAFMSEAGYTTNYFHANNKDFYDRDLTHGADGSYGFDTAHFLDDMPALDGCENGKVVKKNFYDFDKDAKVIQNYLSEYTYKKPEDKAFFTMHMTLSTHGNYDDLLSFGDYPFDSDYYYDSDMTQEQRLTEQNRLKKEFSEKCTVKGFEKYYELIDGYPSVFVADKGIKLNTDPENSLYKPKTLEDVYLRYKRFQAGMMDLDEGINALIYDLERRGELDDTAFVFYADHTAYYNNQNYYLKGVEIGDNWNTALYNIPCFLWYGGSMNCTVSSSGFYEGYHDLSFEATRDKGSSLQGGITVDKFTCSFDILPTLLQLVGYNYNLNLFQGISMFSDRSSVFVSHESSTPFTDKIYFDGVTVSVKDETGNWTHYEYESTLYSDDGFTDEVKTFLKASLKYYEKQDMIEEMYKLDYFSKRPFFGRVAKDGEFFRYAEKFF